MKKGPQENGLYITFIIMTGDTHTMHGCFAIPTPDAHRSERAALTQPAIVH